MLAALLAGTALVSVLIAPLRRPRRPPPHLPAPVRRDGRCRHGLRAHRLAAGAHPRRRSPARSRPTSSSRGRSPRSSRRCSRTRPARDPTRLFGTYNTVATLAGSLGALIALVGSSPHWLLVYPLAAAAGLARHRPACRPRSSAGRSSTGEPLPPLHRSRGIVARLSALFALDSFGGGFVPQTFIAYLFTRKYGASPQTLAHRLLRDRHPAGGLLPGRRPARRPDRAPAHDGLHPPALERPARGRRLRSQPGERDRAPARRASLLSQMDVPTRQAYVVAVVDPSERTAAAAYTNTARYLTRPVAPLVAGAALAGRPRRAVPASPARSRASTTSASTSSSARSPSRVSVRPNPQPRTNARATRPARRARPSRPCATSLPATEGRSPVFTLFGHG